MNTQRHDTFDSFFCHVVVYVVLYFKINIIIPNLFSCQKTRPSFKTKTETLGIKTKTLVFKTKTLKIRSQDQDPSLENSMSGTVVHETKTQVSRTPCLAQSSTRPRPKSRELHVWHSGPRDQDPSLENSMSGTVVHETKTQVSRTPCLAQWSMKSLVIRPP